jgi:hypothetical protein
MMAPRVEKLTKECCRWINKRISEILGNEDDVVIELCSNLLEGSRYVRCLLCGLVRDVLMSMLCAPANVGHVTK